MTTLARKIEANAAAVAELEQKFRDEVWLDLALEAAEFGAWSWDLASGSREIKRNDQYNRLFDLKEDAVWTLEDLLASIHSRDVDRVREQINSAITGKQDRYEVLYRIFKPDGSIRWLHSKGRSTRDPAGNVTHVAGVVRDISQQVRLREERDQFVATLTHDLRNPLAAARASADLVRKFPDQIRERDQHFESILNSIDRVDGMIQDLLDVSRIQAGHEMRLIFEENSLATLLQDSVTDLSTRYGDRFRAKMSGAPDGTWPVRSLRRVIENLATNAVKYGAPQAPIRIEFNRTPENVSLSVHNEGNPISAEDQKTLFQPFRRTVSAESSETTGWGLGLTLVRGVARSLGGGVVVQSTPEFGTTFELTFPIRSQSKVA